jgi:hypothetical protein
MTRNGQTKALEATVIRQDKLPVCKVCHSGLPHLGFNTDVQAKAGHPAGKGMMSGSVLYPRS